MSYVGNPLATAFAPRVKQDLTGQSGNSFTLSHAVSSPNDLSVYINHVRQEPTTAYTVDYTTLSTTGTVASTDDFYIIFDELALQSIAHDEFTALKATSGTFTGAITTTQLASSGPVSGTTLSASSTTTLSDDVTFTGANYNVVWDKSDNALEFADNAKATFGADGDLQIYHDGNHSYISDQGTGGITILNDSWMYIKSADASEIKAIFKTNDSVDLYYNNNKKFETTSAGATVTGDLTVSGGLIPGSINATTVANISMNSQASYLGNYRAIGWGGTANGTTHIYSQINTTDHLVLHAGTGKGIIFETGGSTADRMTLDSDGNLGLGVTPYGHHANWSHMDLGARCGIGHYNAGDSVFSHNNYFDGQWKAKTTGICTQLNFTAAGQALFRYADSTSANGVISWQNTLEINTDGTVKIGVKDTNPNNAWALRCFNTHGTHATIEGWNDNSGGKNLNLFRYDDASIFQVSNGGAVWAAGGYTSDKAFKNIIGDCTEGWSKLKDVQPKSYRYKNIHYEEKDGEEVEVFGDDDLDSNIHYGVIAQDLKKVLPDITYGEEGKMSVDYHGLLMVAINTIKELEARITVLENK